MSQHLQNFRRAARAGFSYLLPQVTFGTPRKQVHARDHTRLAQMAIFICAEWLLICAVGFLWNLRDCQKGNITVPRFVAI